VLIEEYRNSNVRITSVSPGPVDTNIWNQKLEPSTDEQRALMLRPIDIRGHLRLAPGAAEAPAHTRHHGHAASAPSMIPTA
jgi:NAD(P)-dependent dehydrogenase (short-subunit alcohol dehydrogenase family)